jgi:hypothetical protein
MLAVVAVLVVLPVVLVVLVVVVMDRQVAQLQPQQTLGLLILEAVLVVLILY